MADKFDDEAEKLLPCVNESLQMCFTGGHFKVCHAFYRPAVAVWGRGLVADLEQKLTDRNFQLDAFNTKIVELERENARLRIKASEMPVDEVEEHFAALESQLASERAERDELRVMVVDAESDANKSAEAWNQAIAVVSKFQVKDGFSFGRAEVILALRAAQAESERKS